MEGIRVENFNPKAFASKPIQIWHDDWKRTDRMLRYVGKCYVCKRPTWESDDGDNDPRGVLGDHATNALMAEEADKIGKDIPLCAICGNDYDSYKLAEAYANRVWKDPE